MLKSRTSRCIVGKDPPIHVYKIVPCNDIVTNKIHLKIDYII